MGKVLLLVGRGGCGIILGGWGLVGMSGDE